VCSLSESTNKKTPAKSPEHKLQNEAKLSEPNKYRMCVTA